MKKMMLGLVPLVGMAAISQLVYFWLAPKAACALAVYLFGTALTLGHLGLCFGLHMRLGVRRGAAPAAVGTAIWLGTLAVCWVVLAVDASVRTAVFSLVIAAILYLICVAPLLLAAEAREQAPPADGGAAQEAHTPPPLPR